MAAAAETIGGPTAGALDVLLAGGVIVYPTETLYGLGADATNEDAVGRIAALKGRDEGKPILVLVASRRMLGAVVSSVPEHADVLMSAFWPGPLTLVLPARPDLPSLLTAGTGTIGVRLSSHPVARTLVEVAGRPITSTSANPTGERPATTVGEARAYFGDGVDFYVDDGPSAGGVGSTVLDLSHEEPVLLREGAIAARDLERAAGIEIARRR